jgi:hypothetical protein
MLVWAPDFCEMSRALGATRRADRLPHNHGSPIMYACLEKLSIGKFWILQVMGDGLRFMPAKRHENQPAKKVFRACRFLHGALETFDWWARIRNTKRAVVIRR